VIHIGEDTDDEILKMSVSIFIWYNSTE